MSSKIIRRVAMPALLSSGLFISGCTGATDPTQANLFDNITNFNSGEYDRQIAANEAEAARIASDNQARESSIASLNQQKSGNAQTLASLRAEIAQAETELSAAKAAAAGQPAKISQLNQLDVQLASVRRASQAGESPSVLRSELSGIRNSIRVLSQ